MSSCRATSFYLAPNVHRYFKDHTIVALLPDGRWIRIKHRNDVSRIKKDHPDWDGTVLCGPPGGEQSLRENLLDNPVSVERWNVDSRVIEGRRPEGPQFVLHRLSWSGLKAVGGVQQAVASIFPSATKPLVAAASELLKVYGPNAALRLSFAAALRGTLTDDELASLLRQPTAMELQRWVSIDIQRYRSNFLRATETMPSRRKEMARAILSGASLTISEVVTAIDNAAFITPAIAQYLRSVPHLSARDVAIDIAPKRGLGDEEHLSILLSEYRTAHQNLTGNPELKAETVELAVSKGADLLPLLSRAPLTDALLETVLSMDVDEVYGIFQNPRLTPSQGDAVLAYLRENTPPGSQERRRNLGNLAMNHGLPTSLRMEAAMEAASDPLWHTLATNQNSTPDILQHALSFGHLKTVDLVLNTRGSELSIENLRAAASVTPYDSTKECIYLSIVAHEDSTAEEALAIVRSAPKHLLQEIATVSRHPEATALLISRAAELFSPSSDSSEWTNVVAGVLRNKSDSVSYETLSPLLDLADPKTTAMVLSSRLAHLVPEDFRLAMVETLMNSEYPFLEHHFEVISSAFVTPSPAPTLHRYAFANLLPESTPRKWILSNGSLEPGFALEVLSQASLSEILNLTSNVNTLPSDVLTTLLEHKSPNVRRATARRIDLLPEHMEAVLTDPDPEVRKLAEPAYRELATKHYHQARASHARAASLSGSVAYVPPALPHPWVVDGIADLAARSATPPPTSPRREDRSGRDIHALSSLDNGSDTPQALAHHPLEFSVILPSVMRDATSEGSSALDRLFRKKVNDVRDLPGLEAIPFRNINSARDAIDGFTVLVRESSLTGKKKQQQQEEEEEDGSTEVDESSAKETENGATADTENAPPQKMIRLTARVLDSATAMMQNHEYMGNCTDTYIHDVAYGTTRIVGMYDDEGLCRLNIDLSRDEFSDTWRAVQVNTRFNGFGNHGEKAPKDLRGIARTLAARLSSAHTRRSRPDPVFEALLEEEAQLEARLEASHTDTL